MAEDDKDRVERERASWQYRAILLTRGSQTKIGAIILAILGKQRATLPQFGNHAIITSTGFVCTRFTDKRNTIHASSAICQVDEMIARFRNLADELKLTDIERDDMFNKLRVWISKDYRAVRDWSTKAPETGD